MFKFGVKIAKSTKLFFMMFLTKDFLNYNLIYNRIDANNAPKIRAIIITKPKIIATNNNCAFAQFCLLIF